MFEVDRSKCFNTEYFWNKDIKEENFDKIVDFGNYKNLDGPQNLSRIYR